MISMKFYNRDVMNNFDLTKYEVSFRGDHPIFHWAWTFYLLHSNHIRCNIKLPCYNDRNWMISTSFKNQFLPFDENIFDKALEHD